MRLDRIITLCFARHLVGKGSPPARTVVPILMYHGISDNQEDGVSAYYKTNTSSAVFEQQMRLLKEQGFRSVTLTEGAKALQGNNSFPDKTVVITFDDGFADFYSRAFPILKKHGHIATMYLPTAFIRQERQAFKGNNCLTWDEVREMRDYGIEFGSHTVNHPKLYQLSWKEIEEELALSKKQIEAELGQAATSFAYPYAFPQQDAAFVAKLKDLLRGLGYENCVTTIVGRARTGDDLFGLKRLPVNSCDDAALLTAKLEGAYDWLAFPQRMFKKIKPGKLIRQPSHA